MRSISSNKVKLSRVLTEVAREAALRFALPWDLVRLRNEARPGIKEALLYYEPSLGVSFDQFAYKYAQRAATRSGAKIRAQRDHDGDRHSPPPDQHVIEALETFSPQEWQVLIGDCGSADLVALLTHLRANKGQLLLAWDHTPYYGVFEAASKRAMVLRFSRAAEKKRKFIAFLDAFYAAHWRASARKRNIQLLSGPPGSRPLMETVSDAAIAETLNRDGRSKNLYKTNRQVGGMFRRMKNTPLEEFEGDPSEYWTVMSAPWVYVRYRNRLRRERV